MSDVELEIPLLLANESDEVIPDDNGRGPSKYGVTLETYRFISKDPAIPPEAIWDLTLDEAKNFYRLWWKLYHIGLIEDQALAGKLMDFGFNAGPGLATKILQRIVGVKDDGILGPETAASVNGRDPAALLASFKQDIVTHYEALASSNPLLRKYLEGWKKRALA